MTPTAELVDIVLPACTFLEQTRVVTYDIHADHGWNETLSLLDNVKKHGVDGDSIQWKSFGNDGGVTDI